MNPILQSVQIALQNGTQAEAITEIDKIVDFCIEHENGKVLDGWSRELIQLLVAYHMAKDTLLVERNEEGNVLGLLMWYTCDEDDDWLFIQNWTPDREDGNAVFMAFLFAEDSESFKELTRNFIFKCPEVMHKKLLGIRYRSGAPKRVEYTTKLFNKILAI